MAKVIFLMKLFEHFMLEGFLMSIIDNYTT